MITGLETGLSEAGEKYEESERQPEQADLLTLRLGTVSALNTSIIIIPVRHFTS